jgi:hypothetical protein
MRKNSKNSAIIFVTIGKLPETRKHNDVSPI